MMDYKKWMDETRATFRSELNPHLASKGLEPIDCFLDSAIELETRSRSLAIYPTSSSGSSFSMAGNMATGRFTVAFYLDAEATEESIHLAELYYDALISFISDKDFGINSQIDESVIVRMDDGEPVNGALFLIESTISSLTDYGW